MAHEMDLRGLFNQGQAQSPRPTGLAALGWRPTPLPEPFPKMFTSRLEQLDQSIADCQTRRKAAIMRAARATREV